MITSWDREKQTLLDNYIKEKKELRAQFERFLREKEEGFKAEKAEMEAKIRKELEGIEEVKMSWGGHCLRAGECLLRGKRVSRDPL